MGTFAILINGTFAIAYLAYGTFVFGSADTDNLNFWHIGLWFVGGIIWFGYLTPFIESMWSGGKRIKELKQWRIEHDRKAEIKAAREEGYKEGYKEAKERFKRP